MVRSNSADAAALYPGYGIVSFIAYHRYVRLSAGTHQTRPVSLDQ